MSRACLLLLCSTLFVGACAQPRKSDRIPTKERRRADAFRLLQPGPARLASAATANLLQDEEAILEIHFIQVGQGDSTLIKCPNGDRVLIDCGSTKEFDSSAVRSYVRDQLDTESPFIDLLIITHPDQDHYNEIETLLTGSASQAQINVGRVVYVASMAAHGVADFDQWLIEFENKTNLGLDPESEFNVCGPNVSLEVLAANVGSEPNDRSIVVLLTYSSFEAILPGDSTEVTQRYILDHTPLDLLGNVEVLKVEHHGSKVTSMLPETDWFDAVNPDLAVFSCAEDSDYGHPNEDVAGALEPHTISADDHAVTFWKKKNVLSAPTTNDKYRDEAMFITAMEGTIVVRTNGSWYEWVLGP
jgi:beta-lactamase superfamily II metal-dependent hydrolase